MKWGGGILCGKGGIGIPFKKKTKEKKLRQY